MSDELPPGWSRASLRQLVGPDGLMADGDWVESKDQDPNGDVRLTQLADVGDGRFLDKSYRFLTSVKAKQLNCTMLQPRDVLISRLGEPLGKACLFPELDQKCVTVVDVHVVRPGSTAINREWLMHLLNSAPVRQEIDSMSSGTTRKRITGQKLRDLEIPVPPASEQGRIASKIGELFSRIDEGERALEQVSQLVESYRQSVLKVAVTGELTRRWREARKAAGQSIESGDALLTRILTTRREMWESAELSRREAKGTAPKNAAWKRKYKEPRTPDPSHLPDLPEGWVWTCIEALTRIEDNALKAGPFGSSLKKSDYSESGYKVYGQEQVISGDWSIGDYYIGEEKYRELESCKVQPHDVLISLVGTIGKVLVLPEECDQGVINPRLVKVSLDRRTYLPQFFKTYFESAFLKSLYKLEAHGATMDVLNLRIIKSLPFPLCSLEEQSEVASRSMEEFVRASRLRGWIETERQRSKASRQSMLRAAFEGTLVPQDSDDEPASVLLGRIATKSSRADAVVPKAGRKKKSP